MWDTEKCNQTIPEMSPSKLCVEHSSVIIFLVEVGHSFSAGLEDIELCNLCYQILWVLFSCPASLVSVLFKYSLLSYVNYYMALNNNYSVLNPVQLIISSCFELTAISHLRRTECMNQNHPASRETRLKLSLREIFISIFYYIFPYPKIWGRILAPVKSMEKLQLLLRRARILFQVCEINHN